MIITANYIVSQLDGRNGMCRCPAHDDKKPSLSVSDLHGVLLVKCHAGCSQESVISALKARKLWPTAKSSPSQQLGVEEDDDNEAEAELKLKEARKIYKCAINAPEKLKVYFNDWRKIDDVPTHAKFLSANECRQLQYKNKSLPNYPAMVLPIVNSSTGDFQG